MKHVWLLRARDWNERSMEYDDRFVDCFQSSRKARRAAIKHITINKAEKSFNTFTYHKGYYTLTSDSTNTHCTIEKKFVS